jgi:hypothetical protein
MSLTPLGRLDETTSRRRTLVSEIIGNLPPARHQEVAEALQAFAGVAGNMPGSRWADREPGTAPRTRRAPGRKRLTATAEGQS